jgi:hypothetical protein
MRIKLIGVIILFLFCSGCDEMNPKGGEEKKWFS